MPLKSIHASRLNISHPLLAGISNLWLPTPQLSGGTRFWDLRGSGYRNDNGLLTNGPTWRSTAYGPGVETGVTAKNAYVDLAGFQLSRGFSMMFAYTYRFDGTTSGSNTESGVLFSAGFNGVAFRHGFGGNMTLLKSRVAAITDTALAGTAGQFFTAGFSISAAGTATFNTYAQGKLLATASSATTFTGQAPTTLGWDNLTPGTNDEYGRHTILSAALWNGRVLNTLEAQQWHEIAQQGYRPFFNRRRAFFMGSGTITASTFLPTGNKPARVPPAPETPRPKPSPLAFLLSAGVVGTGDWSPYMLQRITRPTLPEPTRPYRASVSWLFDFDHISPVPPSGPGKGLAKPFLRRVPKYDRERRQAHIADQTHQIINSLAGVGQLRKKPPEAGATIANLADWQIMCAAHVDTRAPGVNDDGQSGFTVGCMWVNSSTAQLYVCVDNTNFMAQWRGPI